jgi:hypothetical protein
MEVISCLDTGSIVAQYAFGRRQTTAEKVRGTEVWETKTWHQPMAPHFAAELWVLTTDS